MMNAVTFTPLAGRYDWIYWKSVASAVTGMSSDVLHIHVGLFLLIVAALVVRRAPWHWLPWSIVAVFELANESYDVLQTSYSTDEGNLGAAWHDVWLTMLWPTVILLTFRWLARRGERPAAEAGHERAES